MTKYGSLTFDSKLVWYHLNKSTNKTLHNLTSTNILEHVRHTQSNKSRRCLCNVTRTLLFNGTVEILHCFRINNSTLMFPLTVHTWHRPHLRCPDLTSRRRARSEGLWRPQRSRPARTQLPRMKFTVSQMKTFQATKVINMRAFCHQATKHFTFLIVDKESF